MAASRFVRSGIGVVAWFGLLTGPALPCLADEPSLLTVDRAVLTDSIDATSHRYLHEVATPLTRKRVWLWMELRGTPELLEKLKASNGKLVVHHVWRKYVLTGVQTRLDQALEIGRAEDMDRMTAEVAADGYFTWHTWSMKRRLSPGNWRVDLEYADHEPVMCHNEGEEPHPCFYPFQVE